MTEPGDLPDRLAAVMSDYEKSVRVGDDAWDEQLRRRGQSVRSRPSNRWRAPALTAAAVLVLGIATVGIVRGQHSDRDDPAGLSIGSGDPMQNSGVSTSPAPTTATAQQVSSTSPSTDPTEPSTATDSTDGAFIFPSNPDDLPTVGNNPGQFVGCGSRPGELSSLDVDLALREASPSRGPQEATITNRGHSDFAIEGSPGWVILDAEGRVAAGSIQVAGGRGVKSPVAVGGSVTAFLPYGPHPAELCGSEDQYSLPAGTYAAALTLQTLVDGKPVTYLGDRFQYTLAADNSSKIGPDLSAVPKPGTGNSAGADICGTTPLELSSLGVRSRLSTDHQVLTLFNSADADRAFAGRRGIVLLDGAGKVVSEWTPRPTLAVDAPLELGEGASVAVPAEYQSTLYSLCGEIDPGFDEGLPLGTYSAAVGLINKADGRLYVGAPFVYRSEFFPANACGSKPKTMGAVGLLSTVQFPANGSHPVDLINTTDKDVDYQSSGFVLLNEQGEVISVQAVDHYPEAAGFTRVAANSRSQFDLFDETQPAYLCTATSGELPPGTYLAAPFVGVGTGVVSDLGIPDEDLYLGPLFHYIVN